MEINKIRNFCIVAHIDHGKSTLADRILEFTKTVSKEQMRPQLLDEMELERERGITIRSKTVRLNYAAKDGQEYILNLIDTPGHVDFSYEVSRAIIASEGALLLVDASQGVEAQTLANAVTVEKHALKIIPAINKIDLPTADIEGTKRQIIDGLGILEEPVLVSAKDGTGVEEIIEAIVKRVSAPAGDANKPLKALVFDSYYDPYRGVVVYLRIFDGILNTGMKVNLLSSARTYEVLEVGTLKLAMVPVPSIAAGEVGYIVAGIKDIHDVKIGDTLVDPTAPAERIDSAWIEIKPFVFAGVFPVNPGDFNSLRLAMEKLHLTDASFFYRAISSSALGPGFHCGFLGSLHLEIVKERLEREFSLNLVITSPNVNYRVKLKAEENPADIDNPAKFPAQQDIEYVQEPHVKATIICPNEFISNVIELCKGNRGRVLDIKQMDEHRTIATFELPLSEIIVGFYDSLKSVSKGYASFDYEMTGYRQSDLQKLEILLNYEPVDAFSCIVHESRAHTLGNKLVEKLRTLIPRQMFEIPVQARVGSKIVARSDIRAIRKDVLAKCYGGDITRKRKLLEKQKEGKKKMKQFGRVEIPPEAFMALLKLEK
ncbi:MAG: translation elongation factor 4 [Elusimicrobiota bacterium]